MRKRPSLYINVKEKKKPGPRPIADPTEGSTVWLRRSQWALVKLWQEEGDDNPSANLRRALEDLARFMPRGPRLRVRNDKGQFVPTTKPGPPARVVESESVE